jgi:hypothetical protein
MGLSDWQRLECTLLRDIVQQGQQSCAQTRQCIGRELQQLQHGQQAQHLHEHPSAAAQLQLQPRVPAVQAAHKSTPGVACPAPQPPPPPPPVSAALTAATPAAAGSSDSSPSSSTSCSAVAATPAETWSKSAEQLAHEHRLLAQLQATVDRDRYALRSVAMYMEWTHHLALLSTSSRIALCACACMHPLFGSHMH